MSLHVLTRLPVLLRALRWGLPGRSLRIGLAAFSMVAGIVLATVTLPQIDRLQDNVSTHVGVDGE